MKPVLCIKEGRQTPRLTAADDRFTFIDGQNICLTFKGKMNRVTRLRRCRLAHDLRNRCISPEFADHRFGNAGAGWGFDIGRAYLLCDPSNRHFIGGGLGNRIQTVYRHLICVYSLKQPEPRRDSVISSGYRGEHVRLVAL